MRLSVLGDKESATPVWYEGGLNFTCTQCGNCCTGGPGFVWMSDEEIARLARHLSLTVKETIDRYLRKVAGRYSLRERKTPEGQYDCIFLKEVAGGERRPGSTAPRKACSVYSVRPLQCRTWPFWTENLKEIDNWNRSAVRCHGMNRGRRFSRDEIDAVRDANQWPKRPPTSVAGEAQARQADSERGSS